MSFFMSTVLTYSDCLKEHILFKSISPLPYFLGRPDMLLLNVRSPITCDTKTR